LFNSRPGVEEHSDWATSWATEELWFDSGRGKRFFSHFQSSETHIVSCAACTRGLYQG